MARAFWRATGQSILQAASGGRTLDHPWNDTTPSELQEPLRDAVTATPKQLRRHLQDAMDWTLDNRDLNVANAIIIYGWNENDEGIWLVPTLKLEGGADSSRLKAISRVLLRK